jgi:delta-1-pyrroline-5-carboxylate synthetase
MVCECVQGLELTKVTSPIGVVLIIFEARPDALPQIASLAIRSGNGLLLKGGKEAVHSNSCLHSIITSCLVPACEPSLIGLVTSRSEINELLKLKDDIDLVVPRGSNQLVSYIQNHTSIPVLGHADGICHIYVDENVDLAQVLLPSVPRWPLPHWFLLCCAHLHLLVLGRAPVAVA